MEKEWLDTLAAINPNEVIYTDFVEAANTLTAQLKDEENCDIVIALTHMRQPNDIKLAENASRIDLILGGHDHDVQKEKVSIHPYFISVISLNYILAYIIPKNIVTYRR